MPAFAYSCTHLLNDIKQNDLPQALFNVLITKRSFTFVQRQRLEWVKYEDIKASQIPIWIKRPMIEGISGRKNFFPA